MRRTRKKLAEILAAVVFACLEIPFPLPTLFHLLYLLKSFHIRTWRKNGNLLCDYDDGLLNDFPFINNFPSPTKNEKNCISTTMMTIKFFFISTIFSNILVLFAFIICIVVCRSTIWVSFFFDLHSSYKYFLH